MVPGPEKVDADRGIYPKYVVFKHPRIEATRFDGYSIHGIDVVERPLELVDDFVFVLKPISDKHARIALAAYAESVKDEKPNLAHDIYEVLGDF